MNKYKHRGGGGRCYLNNPLNLQLFSYKEVNNPYKINLFDKNYNTKADISLLDTYINTIVSYYPEYFDSDLLSFDTYEPSQWYHHSSISCLELNNENIGEYDGVAILANFSNINPLDEIEWNPEEYKGENNILGYLHQQNFAQIYCDGYTQNLCKIGNKFGIIQIPLEDTSRAYFLSTRDKICDYYELSNKAENLIKSISSLIDPDLSYNYRRWNSTDPDAKTYDISIKLEGPFSVNGIATNININFDSFFSYANTDGVSDKAFIFGHNAGSSWRGNTISQDQIDDGKITLIKNAIPGSIIVFYDDINGKYGFNLDEEYNSIGLYGYIPEYIVVEDQNIEFPITYKPSSASIEGE